MNGFHVRYIARGAAFLLLIMVMTGCGNGADIQSNSMSSGKVTLKTSHLLPANGVYGAMELTLHFPAGITVQLDPKTGEPTPEVVKLLGATNAAMTFTKVKFAPATTSTGGTLKLQVFDTNGFSSSGNEYVDLQVGAIPGFSPKATDFTLSDFTVSDLDGVVSTPLLPSLTVEIQ